MRAHALALGFVVGCSHAPPAPEPTGPLGVVITRAGLAVPGALVVFGDATGAIVATAMTDASGTAATDLAVAQVTVIDPSKPTRLVTVAHARSGPPITIPLQSDVDPTLPPTAMLTVQAPGGPPPAGAVDFFVRTGCAWRGATSFPVVLPIDARCLGDDGNVPVVIEARTQDGGLEHPGTPLAFSAGLATTSGTDFALTPPAWSTSCLSVDIANPTSMSLSLWQRYDGRELRGTDASFCHPTPSPGYDFAYPLLGLDPGFTASSYSNLGTANNWAIRTTDFPSTPAAFAAGHDPDLLIGNITLGTIDTDGARWTASPELSVADVILAKLTYARSDNTFVEWQLIEPGWADRADLPDLPVSLALDTSIERIAELHYMDASWVSDPGDAQRDLPVVLGPTTEGIRLPAGATVREYTQQFHP